MGIDYARIGLKVGLEIHQQLDSEEKLFCGCKTELFKGEPPVTFLRRLRPTQSELGQIDQAAFFEFQKGVQILYEADRETACLVEMDEEPPHDLNRQALETAIVLSLMLEAEPVDEIHVMRKTVIDGSNTTGFQRTCVVAFDGKVATQSKTVPIQHVGLEEDAARKMGAEANILRYRIDRLCIPLVEVATAPVIRSPGEAEDVALAIGRILRASGRVRRGIGTIRQDLNISIDEGALVEIKGVQELELVSLIVENEVRRQLSLLDVRRELRKRGVKADDLKHECLDVTQVFAGTECQVIQSALKRDHNVYAIRLPGFKGLVKRELAPGVSLGAELADRARFWGRVGGIFHTDELPAYGITVEEVEKLREATKAQPGDVVVFVADSTENASDALKAVRERAKEASKAVPPETRAGNPDGTTRYMRPRPGAARMYPETDVPPIRIRQEYLADLRGQLPELPEKTMRRFVQDYGLNRKLANQVIGSRYGGLFEQAVEKTKVPPTTAAVILTETLKALKRDGVETERVAPRQLMELFHLLGAGKVAKEAASDIIAWLSQDREREAAHAIQALGLTMLRRGELESIVDRLTQENHDLLAKRKKEAFGLLMGLTMKQVRGKAKGQLVSEIVKSKLASLEKEP